VVVGGRASWAAAAPTPAPHGASECSSWTSLTSCTARVRGHSDLDHLDVDHFDFLHCRVSGQLTYCSARVSAQCGSFRSNSELLSLTLVFSPLWLSSPFPLPLPLGAPQAPRTASPGSSAGRTPRTGTPP